jgi:hypothetical protein
MSKKEIEREARCKIEVRGRLRPGRAILEEDTFRFNTGRTGREGADFNVHVRFTDIISLVLEERAGKLTVITRDHEEIVLHLGTRLAVAWKKIMEPRPRRLDLLGIKKKAKLGLIAIDDADLLEEIAAAGVTPSEGDALDVLMVGASHRADLPRLAELAARVKHGGTIWVVHPSGAKTLAAHEIIAAARAARLVDAGEYVLSDSLDAVKLTRV